MVGTMPRMLWGAKACRAAVAVVAALGYALLADEVEAAEAGTRTLTVNPRRTIRRPVPTVPSPILPGAPLPWSGSPALSAPDLSIVDGRTRFLTTGLAQERCPGDRVIFISGVVNPFRPTLPGDGAFMCHADAVAEGFVGP